MTRKRINSKSTFNQFGDNIGILGSVLQSSVVKSGNLLELIIEEELNKKFLKNDFFIVEKEKNKQILTGFNINKETKNQNYFLRKVSIKKDNLIIEVDLLIYFNNTLHIFETKSSPQIDSKKSEQEMNSLFMASVIIADLLENNNNSNNIDISPSFLFFDALDNQDILNGFHGKLFNEDFNKILKIYNKKYNQNFNKAKLINFLDKNNFLELEHIKPFIYSIYNDKSFTKLLNLDLENIKDSRKSKINTILKGTVCQKIKNLPEENKIAIIKALNVLEPNLFQKNLIKNNKM